MHDFLAESVFRILSPIKVSWWYRVQWILGTLLLFSYVVFKQLLCTYLRLLCCCCLYAFGYVLMYLKCFFCYCLYAFASMLLSFFYIQQDLIYLICSSYQNNFLSYLGLLDPRRHEIVMRPFLVNFEGPIYTNLHQFTSIYINIHRFTSIFIKWLPFSFLRSKETWGNP